MIRSAITISLVPQARGGPFVLWDDLPAACRTAGRLGFDAVELFAPSRESVDADQLRRLLDEHNLKLAAVGTGAGWVIHRLTLTAADPGQRQRARDFVRSIIDLGGPFAAPAIIGSMQGRWDDATDRPTALAYLREALDELGDYAKQYNIPLIYEPLNRYETNLINTIGDGVELLRSLGTDNVRLLADLFHMNIEEANIADALRAGGRHIGHVHFVDSNRHPPGRGHTDFKPIAAALHEIGYNGYVSAEAFPIPGPDEAARETIDAYRKYFKDR